MVIGMSTSNVNKVNSVIEVNKVQLCVTGKKVRFCVSNCTEDELSVIVKMLEEAYGDEVYLKRLYA